MLTYLGQLSINDLKIVREVLFKTRSKWEDFGLELGINKDDIDAISKEKCGDTGECLRELLSGYLKKSSASWLSVVSALKAESVGYNQLANEIEAKFLASSTNTKSISGKHELSSVTTNPLLTMTTDIKDTVTTFGFQCACHKCTLESYLDHGCSAMNPEQYPYLNVSKLHVSDRKNLHDRLTIEAKTIMQSFNSLCRNTLTSLETMRHEPGRVALSAIFSEKFTSDELCEDEKQMLAAKTIWEVFKIMKKHLSFLNFELIDNIITDLGTIDDKTRLKEYRCQLHKFCKRHVFEVPCGILGHEPEGENWSTLSISMLLSEKAYNNIASLNTIESSKVEIATILGILPAKLQLNRIDKGCIMLHFTIQTSVAKKIFPLRLAQLAKLRSEGYLVHSMKIGNCKMNPKNIVENVILHTDIYRMEFECPVCFNVVCDPQQISCCQRNICRLCSKEVSTCCVCDSKLFNLTPNTKLQQLLQILHVPCIHAHSGCQWIGRLSNFNKHVNWSPTRNFSLSGCQLFLLTQYEHCVYDNLEGIGCQFQEHQCMYCLYFFRHYDIKSHMESCPNKPLTCVYCNVIISEDVATMHWPVCSHYPVSCPNKCGEIVQRQSLDVHIAKDCPLAIIYCAYKQIGCDERLLRQDMQIHMESAASKHLYLQVTASKKETQTNKKDKQILQAEIRKLRSQIGELNLRLVSQQLSFNQTLEKLGSELQELKTLIKSLSLVEADYETEHLSRRLRALSRSPTIPKISRKRSSSPTPHRRHSSVGLLRISPILVRPSKIKLKSPTISPSHSPDSWKSASPTILGHYSPKFSNVGHSPTYYFGHSSTGTW